MNTPLQIALLGTLLTATVAHADVGKGRQLYETHCQTCHVRLVGGDGSALFTRPDRRVHSLAQLAAQVRRCDANLGLTWFDDQVQDAVDYLNATYYHFKE